MSCDFLEQALPAIRSLHPYQPGKPIEELVREKGLDESAIVKLASNENPMGPPSSAVTAIQSALTGLSRYPDANGFELKKALAAKHHIEADQITLGNGSNDILVLLAQSYLGAGRSAIYSDYAFFVYSLAVKAAGAKGISVPAKNWGHDLQAMASAVTDETRMVFLANPNNPTGTHFNEDELVDFLKQVPGYILVILDEAYLEYHGNSQHNNSISLIEQFPNLVVTRTFSKAYGLAGCRAGYAVSNPDVANILNRLRQPFNVNLLGQVAAQAALNDDQYLSKSRKLNAEGMLQLESGFKSLGLDWIPSAGNFICVDMGRYALPVYEALLCQGVIVRPVGNYGMTNHLRISIGLPDENQRCIHALEAVL